MQKISTLIFDLGGVIINLKPELTWFEQDMLANFEQAELLQLYQSHFFRDFEKGKIEPTVFIEQLKQIALENSSDETKIIQHWNGILLDIPLHRIEFLRQLKTKYRLLLLSNTNYIHLEHIRAYMQQEFGNDILSENFDTCYYSQEIGLRKPDKEIYEFVMKSQNIAPSEILFFDDKAENLTEPQKLGWQTFHVDFNKLSISDLQHLL